MKLSEYEELRRSHHINRTDVAFRGKRGEQTYSEAVAEDVAAAEAAGVVWDPEEEPFPEQIVAWGDSAGRHSAFFTTSPQSSERGLHYREAREVERRYNAWPALEKLVADLSEQQSDTDPCRWGCQLYGVRRILRGGAR